MENIVQKAANILRSSTFVGISRTVEELQRILELEKNPKMLHTVKKIIAHYSEDLRGMRSIASRGLYERLVEMMQREEFARIDGLMLKDNIAKTLKEVLSGIRRDEYRDLYGDNNIPKIV